MQSTGGDGSGGAPERDSPRRERSRERDVGRMLAWIVLPPAVLLAPLSGFLLYMVWHTGSHEPFHTWNLLWTAVDIGAEGNAAVWFASTLWLLVGALAAGAAVTAGRYTRSWWLFALVAVVASVDEAGALHERLFVVGDRLAPFLPFQTFYNWVIPGAVIALVVGALLLRVVVALRPRITAGLVVGGGMFLFGSLVVETLTGLEHREHGATSDLYLGLMYAEEALELVGVAVAVIALGSMFRVARDGGALRVRFDGFRVPAG